MDVPLLPGPINQLPKEILEEISQYVPTTHLLRSCRLVSQTWYPIATSICRKRHVNLKYHKYDSDYVSDLRPQDIFNREAHLPWSAVKFVFNNCIYNQEFYAGVCDSFGASIESLVVCVQSSQYNKFVCQLSKMTNLQEIKLRICPEGLDSVTSFVFPPRGEVQLPKLKQLQMKYQDKSECQFVDLLEFILLNVGAPLKELQLNLEQLNFNSNLKSLKISRLNEVEESEFNHMARIICASKVRKLSLKNLFYVSDQFPIWNILMEQLSSRLDELEIYMYLSENEIENGDAFHLLECCLAKCTGLRTLILLRFGLSGERQYPTSNLLQFPTLGHLENLKIRFHDFHLNPYNPDPEFPVLSFNPLQSTNFPKLKYVHLEVKDGIHYPLTIDIRKVFEPSEVNKFDSVKFLDIGRYHGEGKLSSIFPNLTQITATVADSQYLCPIFDGMRNLIEVDLTLSSNSDNNVLLSDAVHFIRWLTKLRKLTVRSYSDYIGEPIRLEDIGLRNVLTSLHPMDLIIYNTKVNKSDDIVALLRIRHTQVLLL